MNKALLKFSNGETLEIHDAQLIVPIVKVVKDNETFASQDKPYEVWQHHNIGFIPSILELLSNCEYFHLIDNQDKVYNSSAVVSIENL